MHLIIITSHPDFFAELIHIILNNQRAANYSLMTVCISSEKLIIRINHIIFFLITSLHPSYITGRNDVIKQLLNEYMK